MKNEKTQKRVQNAKKGQSNAKNCGKQTPKDCGKGE